MGTAAVIFGGMLLASPATAVELSDTVQLHGFASQAYIKTTDNKYFGNSDKGSFDFRELGVNLSWQALPSLQLAAQVGSRKAGGTEVSANPRFDYAFADLTPLSGEHGRAGFRAGRYRIPLGLYNLTRDVANTRPSIFLPESMYNDSSRHLVLAMDGAEAYGEARTDIGDFFLDYGEGKFILDSIEKQSTRATNSSVWRVLYERDAGLVRLAVTGVDANLDAILPPFANPKVNVNLHLYSAQYNAEEWSLTGEYSPDAVGTISGLVIPGIPGVFPDTVLPDIVQKGEAYYVQGTYRVATDWEALLRYDVHYRDKNDKSGVTAASASGAPAHSFFTKDMTVGLGWSMRPDTKIRAEWHRVNGTSWLSPRENPVASNTKQYWDMFALQVSYSF
jgi:hypothetical protein